MNIDPSLSIVISFFGFCWIFAKKIYPVIISKIDEHIKSVKSQIDEAEKLKDEANIALKNAYAQKDDIERLIKENRKKSEEKIEKLKKENERLLQILRERHESSLKNQLEAELAKQKNNLIDKILDLLIEKLTERLADKNCDINVEIDKRDLSKLIKTRETS